MQRKVAEEQLLGKFRFPEEDPTAVFYCQNLLPWPNDAQPFWTGLRQGRRRLVSMAALDLFDQPLVQAAQVARVVLTPLQPTAWLWTHLKAGEAVEWQRPYRGDVLIQVEEPLGAEYREALLANLDRAQRLELTKMRAARFSSKELSLE
ncbi:hypothetical protein [Deinococcus peraridilitoris]|uniref:Uncharacterized protein n=1 Tax=Deinococcus peraridilitoris (strain DSM 19664 / LMG 22246 / CIP 109416 / KR-200) TaxID=937777 RepID=L0A2U5_DEIPD|nr:hypothetical protein [Deinococcus peraridilitoris]AFZ68151.1 hypothetical protein Deipe_2686 [Deinococcus peraridilitoris DSM 19664]